MPQAPPTQPKEAPIKSDQAKRSLLPGVLHGGGERGQFNEDERAAIFKESLEHFAQALDKVQHAKEEDAKHFIAQGAFQEMERLEKFFSDKKQPYADAKKALKEKLSKRYRLKPGFIGKSREYVKARRPYAARQGEHAMSVDLRGKRIFLWFEKDRVTGIYMAPLDREKTTLTVEDARGLVYGFLDQKIKDESRYTRPKGEWIKHRTFREGRTRVRVGFYAQDLLEITLGELPLKHHKE